MRFRAIQTVIVLFLASVVATAGVAVDSADGTHDVHSQKVERTIAADPAVTVSICVMSGSVSVLGWDKNEVLARSADAGQIEIREKGGAVQSGRATKVEVFVVDRSNGEAIETALEFPSAEIVGAER